MTAGGRSGCLQLSYAVYVQCRIISTVALCSAIAVLVTDQFHPRDDYIELMTYCCRIADIGLHALSSRLRSTVQHSTGCRSFQAQACVASIMSMVQSCLDVWCLYRRVLLDSAPDRSLRYVLESEELVDGICRCLLQLPGGFFKNGIIFFCRGLSLSS